MERYLYSQNIDPNSLTGKTLMQLGSAAIGGVVGGGAGASSALAGDTYNRQLHPQYVQQLEKAAKQFAAEAGISEDEARNRLIVQAYRDQDSSYDNRLTDQGQANDSAAEAFMNGKVSGYLDPITGQAINLSQATEQERGDASLYANDLYNDLQARQAVEQATGIQDASLADWARQDYANRESPQYGENLERWQTDAARSIVQQTEKDFLKFYGETAMAGATGGLLSGATLLGEGATSGGSALGRLLAGKVGAAGIAGGINAISQEIQKDNPSDSIRDDLNKTTF